MRTSLNEIKEIEAYITGTMKPGEKLLFEAKILLNRKLSNHVRLQEQVMLLVQHHQTTNLRATFNACHHALWNDPLKAELKQAITELFKNT